MKTNENLRESEMNEKGFSFYLMKKEDLKEVFRELRKDLLDKVENLKEEKDTLLTPEQTMQMLGCSRPTLWRWKKDEYLVSIKAGGKHLYQLKDINKALNRGENELDKK